MEELQEIWFVGIIGHPEKGPPIVSDLDTRRITMDNQPPGAQPEGTLPPGTVLEQR
jgi:hypothetical protein